MTSGRSRSQRALRRRHSRKQNRRLQARQTEDGQNRLSLRPAGLPSEAEMREEFARQQKAGP